MYITMGFNMWGWPLPAYFTHNHLALTLTQKLLIYGLTLFHLSEDTQKAIFHVMNTEEEQLQMIAYLMKHPQATEQEILDHMGEIIESTQEKSKK